ncbi:MAG: ATP synthase subunit I [Desulfovibrionales bacterium]|nr:MAG: ATP synthase subunit I [Desulfovibrionales bacterium]
MRQLGRINLKIETFLRRSGFHLDDVRILVRNQIYLFFLGCALVVLFRLAPWAVAFGAGCALSTLNFWHLAKGLQSIVHNPDGAVAASLIRFYGRLALSGLALFGLIIWASLPLAALIAGLSTVIVNILFWGVFRFHRQKVKEA